MIYNFLLEHNWKEQSFEINYCVNYLQLNNLVYQSKTCFKNKQITFKQKVLEDRDCKIVFTLTNNFSLTVKVQIALPCGVASMRERLLIHLGLTIKVK